MQDDRRLPHHHGGGAQIDGPCSERCNCSIRRGEIRLRLRLLSAWCEKLNGCGRSDLYATHIPRYVRCWRRIREQCRDGRRSPWQRCARFTNVWLQRAQSATKPTKHIAINLACAGLLGHLITSCHRPYNKCSQSALEGQEGHYQGAESAPTQGIKASWRSFSSGTVFLLFPSIFDRCRVPCTADSFP